MPVVSLRFKLPDEKEDFDHALKAFNYKMVIDEFDQFLRSKIKYSEEVSIDLEAARDMLHQIMRENDVAN